VAVLPSETRGAASEGRADRGIVRTVVTPAQDAPLKRAQRRALHRNSRLPPRESGKEDDSTNHVRAAPKAPSDLFLADAGVRQLKHPSLESSQPRVLQRAEPIGCKLRLGTGMSPTGPEVCAGLTPRGALLGSVVAHHNIHTTPGSSPMPRAALARASENTWNGRSSSRCLVSDRWYIHC
jgi:hypothetical protein